jgi:hypothetical protein
MVRPKNFLFHIVTRDRFYGSLIGVDYGEGLILKEPLLLKTPMEII